ncbi:MAG: carboxylesterase family protein [Edaphobacter sp.]
MREFDRRTLLRYSGMAAASMMLQGGRFAFGEDAPLATTTAGKVSGRVENGINVFRGIPYGEDTQKTRFKAPLPVVAWSGVKACVEWSTRAPQLTGERAGRGAEASGEQVRAGFHLPPDKGEQSEDCLHLNVWTPALRDGKKRPVLFYIHGGAYNNGTVNCDLYDGNRLCHRGNVVVVTVNHRLNAFGYMYLGELGGKEYADSGNAGMLDIILALKWVQQNITEFGGDASRVLIFGQSGGGAKCATLMAMPAAKGLFHRVVTMSGQQVTAKPTVIANEVTKDVLDKLGVKYDQLDALKTLPMEKIQEAARVSSAWLPVRDGGVLPRDPFDPEAPGISAAVPMILANTHDETVTSAAGRTGVLTWEQAPEALKNSVGQYLGSYTPEQVIRRYREIYPDRDAAHIVVAAAVAFRAWPGQVIEADRRAADARSQAHTWVYRIDWKVPFPGNWALHTIDLPFLFDNVALAPGMCGASAEEQAAAQPLATRMSEMLIEFARTGDPNCKEVPHWPSYDLKDRNTMIFDNETRVEKDPRGAEREFAAGAHYRQPGT